MTAPAPPRATVADLLGRLPTPEGKRFTTAFTHGTLLVELYTGRRRRGRSSAAAEAWGLSMASR